MGSYIDASGRRADFDAMSFVTTYESTYFLNQPRTVRGIRQSSRYVEEEIEKVLTRGFSSCVDVVRVMAWKAGKIRHRCSEDSRSFVYCSDWNGIEEAAMKKGRVPSASLREGSALDIPSFAVYVYQEVRTWARELQKAGGQGILEKMEKVCPAGMGTTQMLSLLYFISNGDYPIIDRFAGTALNAIKRGVCSEDDAPGVSLWESLPEKGSRGFKTVFQDRILPYRESLDDLFGNEWKASRRIDRSLWVYGHRFPGTSCR